MYHGKIRVTMIDVSGLRFVSDWLRELQEFSRKIKNNINVFNKKKAKKGEVEQENRSLSICIKS